jgi:hypothetical protein
MRLVRPRLTGGRRASGRWSSCAQCHVPNIICTMLRVARERRACQDGVRVVFGDGPQRRFPTQRGGTATLGRALPTAKAHRQECPCHKKRNNRRDAGATRPANLRMLSFRVFRAFASRCHPEPIRAERGRVRDLLLLLLFALISRFSLSSERAKRRRWHSHSWLCSSNCESTQAGVPVPQKTANPNPRASF